MFLSYKITSYSVEVFYKIILHNNTIIICQNVATDIGGNEDCRFSMWERPSIYYTQYVRATRTTLKSHSS